jgi:hypothetical protein
VIACVIACVIGSLIACVIGSVIACVIDDSMRHKQTLERTNCFPHFNFPSLGIISYEGEVHASGIQVAKNVKKT